jgi:hypothetical protein
MTFCRRPALECGFWRFGWTRCALFALFMTTCWWQPARGQVAASIAGRVVDSSGAPVASATVTAANRETGAMRTATTDDAGRYQIVSLAIGPYEVSVSKSGFQDAIRTGIRLVVGQEAIVDLTLQVSGVKSEVRVSEDAPLVSPTTQDIFGLVGEQQVKDLPLNGRS